MGTRHFRQMQRFWKKVTRSPGACWEWQASLDKHGYGKFWMGEQRRAEKAHRVSWEMANGRLLAKNEMVTHSCDNRRCVNPGHLRLGTPKSNMVEKMERGRAPRGEVASHVGFSEHDIVNIRYRYSNGSESQQEIANDYGVSQVTISHILRRRTWAHVKETSWREE